MADEHTPAEQMIRSTFTAPNLIEHGDEEHPLLERARELVDEDFPTAEERAQRAGKKPTGR
ncbi:MAG: hypothetical protein WCE44_00760 [Candidatus Velthaea sp.]|jgi:hypothetical protein